VEQACIKDLPEFNNLYNKIKFVVPTQAIKNFIYLFLLKLLVLLSKDGLAFTSFSKVQMKAMIFWLE
jgi:hypothetical protein